MTFIFSHYLSRLTRVRQNTGRLAAERKGSEGKARRSKQRRIFVKENLKVERGVSKKIARAARFFSESRNQNKKMACNSDTCQSGCNRDDDFINGYQNGLTVSQDGGSSYGASPGCSSEPPPNGRGLCIKCKVNETIDVGKFCADCFRGNLFGKFRFAVTSNAMISPSYNVLVAFSGGASSRVALQFVHEMQQKVQKNFDANRDRSLPVFGVGVAYIDESASFPVPYDFDQAINEMKLVVFSLAPPAKQFHIVPTEIMYSPDCASGKDQLRELITAIGDVTGKEDFMEHLRMRCLQKIALENGYTKLVLAAGNVHITNSLSCP